MNFILKSTSCCAGTKWINISRLHCWIFFHVISTVFSLKKNHFILIHLNSLFLNISFYANNEYHILYSFFIHFTIKMIQTTDHICMPTQFWILFKLLTNEIYFLNKNVIQTFNLQYYSGGFSSYFVCIKIHSYSRHIINASSSQWISLMFYVILAPKCEKMVLPLDVSFYISTRRLKIMATIQFNK